MIMSNKADSMEPRPISKWWLFSALLLVAVALNVSLYIKVALYGP